MGDSSNTGGMGMHKHGVSGKAGKSPRFRHNQQIELQREAEHKRKRRRKKKTYKSVSEAIDNHKIR